LGTGKRKEQIRRNTLAALLLLTAAMVGLGSREVGAESPPRGEYVSTLEEICKPGVEATQRAMRGVRDDIRAERDSVAAGKFRRGTRIFADTLGKISPIPRPPADLAKLKKWFAYLEAQESYLRAITEHLAAGRAIKAQRSTARFIHNGNLANNAVLAFGFNYCSFRFSRFG
jgi:hypothetical protein